ncbi:uncharacterized protein [Atheta coriaria]|uniref:uncharacterized protein isoform X1 n=1 Tax=Dalotia coriaria TaxID=877792 RepID=UPI0031F3AAEC
MTAGRKAIIAFFLNKFRLIQLEPGKHNYKTYLLLIFILASHAIQIYYGGMLVAKSDKFLTMAKGVKSIIVNFQVGKIIAGLREDDIDYLLRDTEKFWNSESTEKMYKLALRGAQAFQNLIYAAYAVIVIIPIAMGSLPFDLYIPEFPGAFWLLAALQCLQFLYAMVIVIAVDCLFLCLSLFVLAQFQLLNKRLERLGKNSNIMYEEAKICVTRHDFLMQYTERYAGMFRYALLSQYCITTLSVCVEMFVFTKQNVVGMAVSCFYLIALLFQLALYCFPADMVIQEALYSSQAIINSKWYEHPRFAKIFVQHIIRRSHKIIVFSAAGLVNINRVAFTMIFKWSVSFYALMRDMAKIID